ncbi:CAP domain-containing protein [Vaginisenegalia massiliensis]|uniref:CAP domain-containing protein n=1 Tax=Vaginisenegalia massiliensis TaxID=2058294 RepID=UPI000F534A0D|nr:CAP domain-containing protein [Vaginisenegalia massiliensis]
MNKKSTLMTSMTLAAGILAVANVEDVQAANAPASVTTETATTQATNPVQAPVTSQEVATAKEAVDAAQVAVDQQTSVVSDAQAAEKTADAQLAQANDNLLNANNNLKIAETGGISNAETAVNQAQAELTSAQEVSNDKLIVANVLEQQVQQYQSLVNQAQNQVDEKAQQVALAQAAVDAAQAALDATNSAQLQQELEAAKANLQAADTAYIEAQADLVAAQAHDQALKDQQAKLFADLNQAQADLTAAQTTQTNQTNQVNNSQTAVDAAEAAVAAANQTVADITGQLTPANPALSNLCYPEVTTPDAGNVLVAVEGEFYSPEVAAILTRLNEIRKEAFDLGLVDRYVPIKCSKELEKMAMTRSAESSSTLNHERWTNKDIFTVDAGSNMDVNGENLAWNNNLDSSAFVEAIGQWYEEKENLISNNGGVTGHYTSIINPDYTHTGLGAFQTVADIGGQDWTCITQLFAISANAEDEAPVSDYGLKNQVLEADPSKLNDIKISPTSLVLDKGSSLNVQMTGNFNYQEPGFVLNTPFVFLSGINWQVTDSSVASIDSIGKLTGLKVGNTTVSANLNGTTYMADIKVVDLAQAKAELQAKQALLIATQSTLATVKAMLAETSKQVAELQSQVNTLQNEYDQAVSQSLIVPTAQAKVSQAYANLQLANESYDLAQIAFDEIQVVAAEKLQVLEAAQAELAFKNQDLTKAQADLTAAQAELDQVKVEQIKAQEELAKSQEIVKQAEANLAAKKQALLDLENAPALVEKAKAEQEAAYKAWLAAKDELGLEEAKLKDLELVLKQAQDKYQRLLAAFLDQLANKKLTIEKEGKIAKEVLNDKGELVDYLAIAKPDKNMKPVVKRIEGKPIAKKSAVKPASKDTSLPATGEDLTHPIFTPAVVSILLGLGISIVGNKKGIEE